jgi:hypothetical protein
MPPSDLNRLIGLGLSACRRARNPVERYEARAILRNAMAIRRSLRDGRTRPFDPLSVRRLGDHVSRFCDLRTQA